MSQTVLAQIYMPNTEQTQAFPQPSQPQVIVQSVYCPQLGVYTTPVNCPAKQTKCSSQWQNGELITVCQ